MNEIPLELDDYKKPQKKGGSGPPNKMNDLPYKEWMKFQKSFFRFDSIPQLYSDICYFFTKEIWEDNQKSNILILSSSKSEIPIIKREVKYECEIITLNEIYKRLKYENSNNQRYDHIILDVSNLEFQKLLKNDNNQVVINQLSFLLRSLLRADKYCSIILKQESNEYIAWQLSNVLRGDLKLRDEKIGINNQFDELIYCLFFQSNNDERNLKNDNNIIISKKTNFNIPSWIIPKPPPRKKNEILHPAKFPETLIEQFIKIFTKEGDNVFDPMVGTGSTVLASIQSNRNGFGLELIDEFAEIASRRISMATSSLTLFDNDLKSKGVIIQGNAKEITNIKEIKNVTFHYCITSPPYWSMLTNPGSENQKKRREKKLKLQYSEDNPDDLGNIQDYDVFVDVLVKIYIAMSIKLANNGILTIIVKNIKREHTVYHLAWDLTYKLCQSGQFAFIGNTMWCQDDVGLKPFAVGIHWVSNTLHQYCLHFMKLKD